MKKIITICLAVCTLTGCYASYTPNPEVIEKNKPVSAGNVSEAGVSTKGSKDNANKNVFDSLTMDEKKNLNVFFSNFAEAYFDEYDRNNISAKELIDFAFIHNRVNGTSEEGYDMFDSPYFENVMGIKVEVMDMLIDRYFGVSVPHKDIIRVNEYGRNEGWAFKDGYVYTEAADGESYDYFATTYDMIDLGDGTFEARYDKYYVEPDLMDKKYYSYTPQEAQNDSDLEYNGSYIAVIKPATVDGKKTWQLYSLKKS